MILVIFALLLSILFVQFMINKKALKFLETFSKKKKMKISCFQILVLSLLLLLFHFTWCDSQEEQATHVQYLEIILDNLESISQKFQTKLSSQHLTLDKRLQIQPQIQTLSKIIKRTRWAKEEIKNLNTMLHRPLIPRHMILDFVSKNTYARLGKSKHPNGGVGLIAIKDIPANSSPIPQIDSPCSEFIQEPLLVHVSELNAPAMVPSVKKLLYDFVNPYNNSYLLPSGGLNTMTPDFYMNHNHENPNVGVYDVPECGYLVFRTIREVKAGEELTFNYKTYGNSEDYVREMLEKSNSQILVKDEL